jgi:transcriptional regulator with XRE-family HTH domain
MNRELLSQKLKELRIVNNYTQDYVAAALGVVAQHGHCLALVKVGVAGGAVAYAAAQQLVLTGEKFAHHDAARQND